VLGCVLDLGGVLIVYVVLSVVLFKENTILAVRIYFSSLIYLLSIYGVIYLSSVGFGNSYM
jgi:hypothetical protein